MRVSALVVFLALCVAGCGSSPTEPDDDSISQNSCFAIVGNHGTITATISGLPNFSGRIPNGNNVRTATAIPSGAIFNIQAQDLSDGTSVLITGPMKVGTTVMQIGTGDETAISVLVQTRSCAAATGTWAANLAQGGASVTLTSASTSGASGSFLATVVPVAGSGAVGNKNVSGTFNVTF